jgi:putative hydrolase of the HAD superfamily
MKRFVLFDLGGTLAKYFSRDEWPVVREETILRIEALLRGRDRLTLTPEDVRRRVADEDHESPDCRVRPLEGRLARIFDLAPRDPLVDELCLEFSKPAFARGRLYDDAVETLAAVRAMGCRTAIVSNLPWGSPARLWHGEVARLGLDTLVDAVVLCADVGWRKPARQIFDRALAELSAAVDESVFVGDDPRWDIVGPQRMGMDAVLIIRGGPQAHQLGHTAEKVITSLAELPTILRDAR